MPKGLKEDETLMNFRIPVTVRDAFIAKARENRTTASALILEFVEAYLAGETTNAHQLQQIENKIAELEAFKERTEALLGKLAA